MLVKTFPKMTTVKQDFTASPPLDIPAVLEKELAPLSIKPGARIAVASGSRGIENYAKATAETIRILKAKGARPYIFPAMGSHGGATPEGQREILAGYGISEQSMGVEIRDTMEVKEVGRTEDNVAVYASVAALESDGVVVINRVKPHTDFGGAYGSGLIKMLAIGVGKQAGAESCHRAVARLGHERVFRSVARVMIQNAPILCGLGLVEDALHQTCRIRMLKAGELDEKEPELLAEASAKMARLPYSEIDLLIVDRMGKNITGAGMDPNVIGRTVHGYSSHLINRPKDPPVILRIFVRELTPESHGNAIGLGMADFATTRLVKSIDRDATQMNVMTSISVQSAKIPVNFDTDREAIAQALDSLALPDPLKARVVRIKDTLSLGTLQISEVCDRNGLVPLGGPAEMTFDASGNLLPF